MDSSTKLTLRLKRSVIDRAKRIAKMRGVSVSSMVENYFRVLSDGKEKGKKSKKKKDISISPRVKALFDTFRSVAKELPKDYDFREDRTNYLIEKYK